MRKVIIIGAAGRDFHNFNTFFRDNSDYKVMAFTAAQIPDIDGRKYPPELSGDLYPEGIPIYGEAELPRLIHEYGIDDCVFSYSDVLFPGHGGFGSGECGRCRFQIVGSQ
ncbi:hypothetical protein [Geofilum rubicundum]|uniref:GTPase n=1 Tax=Geofilum rubicundum JCM 15548 TaxID=1236989 RepID=A0A0E9LTU1_9BACT|nr:hypothetical protein [Geofilum rubicundum]GAO28987.1 hypothetical protein JCM15548_11138 [Geofilum rubicundum JCM 15548]